MIVYYHICKGILYFRMREVSTCQNSITLRISQRALCIKFYWLAISILTKFYYTLYIRIIYIFQYVDFIYCNRDSQRNLYLFIPSECDSKLNQTAQIMLFLRRTAERNKRTNKSRGPASSITNEHIDIRIFLCIKESKRKM